MPRRMVSRNRYAEQASSSTHVFARNPLRILGGLMCRAIIGTLYKTPTIIEVSRSPRRPPTILMLPIPSGVLTSIDACAEAIERAFSRPPAASAMLVSCFARMKTAVRFKKLRLMTLWHRHIIAVCKRPASEMGDLFVSGLHLVMSSGTIQ